MTKLTGLIRLSRWRLDEKRRALAELEALAAHLHQQTRDLADQMRREQAFADTQEGVPRSLGPYIQATLDRRTHLAQSIAEVEQRITIARDEIADAFREVKRYELVEADRGRRLRAQEKHRETEALDEIGAVRFQRARQEAGGNRGG